MLRKVRSGAEAPPSEAVERNIELRKALNLAFDFESLNRTIFFGQYERIDSFFYGIDLASSGLPHIRIPNP